MDMYFKQLFAPLVGPNPADDGSAAKLRFALGRVNRFQNPQVKEVIMSILNKLFVPIVGLIPAGFGSAAKMQSMLLAFILGTFSLWVSPAAAQKYVTDPTTGKMVSAPEYGGTLTYAKKSEPPHTDSWFGSPAGAAHSGVVEKLADGNWGIDRNEHHFKNLSLNNINFPVSYDSCSQLKQCEISLIIFFESDHYLAKPVEP